MLDSGVELAKKLLRKASSRADGMNDFTAWHQCGAATIGEILTDARAVVAEAKQKSEDSEEREYL